MLSYVVYMWWTLPSLELQTVFLDQIFFIYGEKSLHYYLINVVNIKILNLDETNKIN